MKMTGIQIVNQIHQEIFECSQFMKDLLQDHLRTNCSTSDDTPLLFTLATPQESRAFLWALYAKYVLPFLYDPFSGSSSHPHPHFLDQKTSKLQLKDKATLNDSAISHL